MPTGESMTDRGRSSSAKRDGAEGRRLRAIFNPLYADEDTARIIDDHPEVDFSTAMNADELAAVIEDADFMVSNNRSYDEEIARVVCEKGRRLRWIQFATAGVERAIKFGVPPEVTICYAGGLKGPTVAEHAMMLILARYRRLRDIEAARQRRQWSRHELFPTLRTVEGATITVAGLGAIGSEVARKAKAFDMKVIGISRAGRAGPTIDEVVPRTELHAVLPRTDILVLCLPVEPQTFHFIGERELELMKPDSLLVNVSRGDLVDQEALVRALKTGKIAGAAVDVVEGEPLPPESELWDLENLLISPHIGGGGKGSYDRFKDIFDNNLARFIAGEPLLMVVDRTSSDDPSPRP